MLYTFSAYFLLKHEKFYPYLSRSDSSLLFADRAGWDMDQGLQ